MNFAKQSDRLIGIACVRSGSDGGIGMHLIPRELYVRRGFLSADAARCRARSRRRHDHRAAFEPFPVSRYLSYPSLVLIALTVIYTGLFSIFLIPG